MQFRGHHHVRCRVILDVADDVLALAEGIGGLAGEVVHVDERIAEGRGEFVAPRMIDKGDKAQDGHSFDAFFARLVVDRDVDRGVVHVVGDPRTVDGKAAKRCFLADIDVRAQVQAPPGDRGAPVYSGDRVQVFNPDVPVDTRQLDIPEVEPFPVLERDIRDRKAPAKRFQFDTAFILAALRRTSRAREGDRQPGLALDRHVAKLDVAVEGHPRRTPVLHGVREYVNIHERAPVLTGAKLAKFGIRVAQADRGLAGIGTGAEHFKLELGEQLAERRVEVILDPKAGLADGEVEVAVRPPLILVRGEFGRPDNIEPIRVDLSEVIAGVHHDEAVEVHGFLHVIVLGA